MVLILYVHSFLDNSGASRLVFSSSFSLCESVLLYFTISTTISESFRKKAGDSITRNLRNHHVRMEIKGGQKEEFLVVAAVKKP